MMVRRSRAVVAMILIVAFPLSGCSSWGCNKGFQADFAPDASGAATPRAAVDTWLASDHAGPDSGWRWAGSSASAVVFSSGDWQVAVVEAPAGGYLVESGSCSTSR